MDILKSIIYKSIVNSVSDLFVYKNILFGNMQRKVNEQYRI